MLTFQMKVRNDKGWVKVVYVSAETFHEAIKKMKTEHGNEWVVCESNMMFAK